MTHEDHTLLKKTQNAYFNITYIPQKTRQQALNKRNLLFSGRWQLLSLMLEKNDNAQPRKKVELLGEKSSQTLKFFAIILSNIHGEIILKFRAFIHKSLMKN